MAAGWDLEEATARYLGGERQKDVAKYYGIGQTKLIRRFVEAGVCLRVGARLLSEEACQEFFRRYESGEKISPLLSEYGISRGTALTILARQQAMMRAASEESRRYSLNEHAFDFDEAPTEQQAMWAGLLQADGCLCERGGTYIVSLSLKKGDISHLKAFRDFLGSGHPIYGYLGQRTFSVSSHKLGEAVIRLGIIPRKTGVESFPPVLVDRPAAYRGLIDGDGSLGLYRNGNNTQYPRISCVGGLMMMKQLAEFVLRRLGYGARVVERCGCWLVHYAGRKAQEVTRLLYGDCEFSLARKLFLAKRIMSLTIRHRESKTHPMISVVPASLKVIKDRIKNTSVLREKQKAIVSRRAESDRVKEIERTVLEERIVSSYLSGNSSVDISRKEGLSSVQVCNILRKHRVRTRGPREAGRLAWGEQRKLARKRRLFRPPATELELAVIDDYRRGVGHEEINKSRGVSVPTIYAIIHRNGIPLKVPRIKVDSSDVVSSYESGESAPSIAARYGITSTSIYDILDKHSIRRRRKLPSSDIQEGIVSSFSSGEICRDIAKKFAVKPYMVRKILVRRGLSPPPRLPTSDVKDKIVSAFRAGETITSIADRLRISRRVLRKILADFRSAPKAHALKLSIDKETLIASRYSAGEPPHRLAREYLVSRKTIYDILRRQRVRLRTRSESRRLWMAREKQA